jgi:hypothetical protein
MIEAEVGRVWYGMSGLTVTVAIVLGKTPSVRCSRWSQRHAGRLPAFPSAAQASLPELIRGGAGSADRLPLSTASVAPGARSMQCSCRHATCQ